MVAVARLCDAEVQEAAAARAARVAAVEAAVMRAAEVARLAMERYRRQRRPPPNSVWRWKGCTRRRRRRVRWRVAMRWS